MIRMGISLVCRLDVAAEVVQSVQGVVEVQSRTLIVHHQGRLAGAKERRFLISFKPRRDQRLVAVQPQRPLGCQVPYYGNVSRKQSEISLYETMESMVRCMNVWEENYG